MENWGEPSVGEEKHISRREFMKIAGIAGATVGMGAGLGGLVAACGAEETTTTTTTGLGTTATTTATTVPVTSTNVTSAAELGREVKLGFVTPLTGAYAQAAIPDAYMIDRWNEFVGDGQVLGDGLKHKITFIVRDSQSTSDRSAQVAGDLINNDAVDMLLASSSPDNVNPVSDQAEAFGVPCISSAVPWEAWWFGRKAPATGFKWTYHLFPGQADLQALYFDMWSQFPNNKVYGAMWPNDADGAAYRNSWPKVLDAKGWKLSDPGSFADGLEDYSAVISLFKKDAAEIVAGVIGPPDLTNFWKQATQQGYKPKQITIGKALEDHQTMEALGSMGLGMTTFIYWSPKFPFKSSLTGETCQQYADEFEKRTGTQWMQRLHHYLLFELAFDALKRTTNLDDKENIIANVKTLKLDTFTGPVDFTAPVDPAGRHPVPNVYTTPAAGGQWVKGDKWPYDLKITSNARFPGIPVEGPTVPLNA